MQSVLLALLLLAAIKLCWWPCCSWLLPRQLGTVPFVWCVDSRVVKPTICYVCAAPRLRVRLLIGTENALVQEGNSSCHCVLSIKAIDSWSLSSTLRILAGSRGALLLCRAAVAGFGCCPEQVRGAWCVVCVSLLHR